MMLERGMYLVPTLMAPARVPAAAGDKWHSDAGRLSSGQPWLPSTRRSLVGPRCQRSRCHAAQSAQEITSPQQRGTRFRQRRLRLWCVSPSDTSTSDCPTGASAALETGPSSPGCSRSNVDRWLLRPFARSRGSDLHEQLPGQEQGNGWPRGHYTADHRCLGGRHVGGEAGADAGLQRRPRQCSDRHVGSASDQHRHVFVHRPTVTARSHRVAGRWGQARS
jgi:hypothetical protein